METVHVSRIDPDLAAQLLAGTARLDPRGTLTEQDLPALAARAHCFAATDAAGKSQAVYLLGVQNGVVWVNACKGFGPADWTGLLLPIIEAQAQGAARVSFQTARPGLMRRALRQGYSVRGWIMGKDLQ